MQYTEKEAQDWLIISFLRGGAACGASSGYLQAQSGLKVIGEFDKLKSRVSFQILSPIEEWSGSLPY